MLRILGGVTDSFVFILHGEEFIVRENVFVQHLTDVSFNAAKQKQTKRISIITHYSCSFSLLFSWSCLFDKIYFTLCNSYLTFFYAIMLQNSLESYLSCFAKYGSCVHRLLCFEEESICGSCDLSITDPNSLTCQTFQAFANAISNFIKSLRKDLTIIEKKIIQQGRWKFCRFLE